MEEPKEKWTCDICNEDISEWYNPEYCCKQASSDCGCRGLPIYPPICSELCWNKLTIGKEH